MNRNEEYLPDWTKYLLAVFLILISLLAGFWMNSQLKSVISLQPVQDAVVVAISELTSYAVLVWGFILLMVFFGKRIVSTETSEQRGVSLTSSLIAIGALVGIPLSIILVKLMESI